MGPAFASKYTANHLVWTQNWPQTLLPMVSYGPITGPTCAADGLAWAQHWPKNILPMILYGPSTGPKLCYRWSYMGLLISDVVHLSGTYLILLIRIRL